MTIENIATQNFEQGSIVSHVKMQIYNFIHKYG